MKPSQTLREAIKLIRKHGWHQGNYVGPGGCLCAAAAIHEATGYEDTANVAAKREILELVYGPGNHRSIPTWNDHPSQTRYNVLRTMGRAARKLEKEGR